MVLIVIGCDVDKAAALRLHPLWPQTEESLGAAEDI